MDHPYSTCLTCCCTASNSNSGHLQTISNHKSGRPRLWLLVSAPEVSHPREGLSHPTSKKADQTYLDHPGPGCPVWVDPYSLYRVVRWTPQAHGPGIKTSRSLWAFLAFKAPSSPLPPAPSARGQGAGETVRWRRSAKLNSLGCASCMYRVNSKHQYCKQNKTFPSWEG